MTAKYSSWLFMVVVALHAISAAAQEQMQPLIGGHLSWQVDPEFMNGERYVDLELTTTFVKKEGCTYIPGSTVQCPGVDAAGCSGQGPECTIAEYFGVLCVAQLLEHVNNAGRKVLYVPRESNNENYFAQCVHELNIQVGVEVYVVNSNGGREVPAIDEVGKVNEFTVLQVYDQDPADADLAEDRMRHGTSMVVGRLNHRVSVNPKAAGVMAWVAPRVGFKNLVRERGLLLPECPGTGTAATEPCMGNIESLEREQSTDTNSFEGDGTTRAWIGLPFSSSDGYWHPNSVDRFRQFWGANRAECGNAVYGCHQTGAPALETLVPLCATEGDAVQCAEHPLYNYYSPVVPFPHVVEVTLNTLSVARQYATPDEPLAFTAPHQGFAMQGYDLDGHKMTQFTHGLYKELNIDPNDEGVKRNNDKFRVDCIFHDDPPAAGEGWPLAATATGCREVFDFDRDEDNARGNILKADYAFALDVEPQKFNQHHVNTLDFAAGYVVTQSQVEIANSHRTDSASVQNIFATFPCHPGETNLPPVIETVQTNYTCNFWEPCQIELRARDYTRTGTQSTNEIVIQPAIGMPFGAANELVLLDDDQQECRGAGGEVACAYRLLDTSVYDVSSESFYPSAVGRIFVRCVVAYDVFSASQDGASSCPSTPFCFKIQIAGSRPEFVAPTPLGRSFDDLQQEVLNRHDYVTCEDSTMRLQIKVQDGIPHDKRHLQDDQKRFRIFVFDAEIASAEETGGFTDPNFFAADGEIPPFETCGEFVDYGAERVGSNQNQTTKNAKQEPYSVVSDYLPFVEFTSNHDTLLEVRHLPKTELRNGVVIRTDDCELQQGADLAQCRVKQVNMDQVVCAVGYDNSRSLTKRWVGKRNPDGNDLAERLRDGSGGDYASDTHCWLIRVAAPPVFVTDPAGLYTPFGDRNVIDTTDNAAAYRTEKFRVGEEKTVTFLAQDPNSKDTIAVFILASPGIPRGMVVGESECVPTDDLMCQTRDVLGQPAEFLSSASSSCSRAKRSITWAPGPETAGENFTVCAVARDDSTLCAGTGGPAFATPEGWFGERHCVRIYVEDVVVRWEGNLGEYVTPDDVEWEVRSYVGCEEVLELKAMSRETDLAPGQMPYRLFGELDAERMEARAVAATDVDTSTADTLRVTWNPQRGMEGQAVEVCFLAQKEESLRVAGEEPMRHACRGGPMHLVGCTTHQDCGAEGLCQPMCLRMLVQRCEYCVKEDDTLTYVVRQYGFETNWLRLWALNSYQGSMGTEFIPEARFLGEAGTEGRALLKSPDLVVDKQSGSRFRVGAVYHTDGRESAFNVSTRFRTTIKTLLSMNPDVEWDSPNDALPAAQELCIVPCTLSHL